MSVLEIIAPEDEYSRQYRIGHFLTILVCVAALLYGINLRATVVNAFTTYENIVVGVAVDYPANWLLDTNGDYVLRARDVTRIGYKTNLVIQVRPIGPSMTARNVFDNLHIERSIDLSTYDHLSTQTFDFREELQATEMNYTFVATDPNKFLESVPVVVRGRDIMFIREGQAIIVTFRSDSLTFEDDIVDFERMLSTLEF